jgi:LPXTG-motif cell wall-anchored protein
VRLCIGVVVTLALAFAGPLSQAALAKGGSKIEPGSLAFTGINTDVIVLLGAGLIAGGLLMRRRTAHPRRR